MHTTRWYVLRQRVYLIWYKRQASAENIEHNWRYADKDKNGVLTRDEYQSALGGDDEDTDEFMRIGR